MCEAWPWEAKVEVRGGKGWRVKGGREGRGVNRGRGSAMTLSHKLSRDTWRIQYVSSL